MNLNLSILRIGLLFLSKSINIISVANHQDVLEWAYLALQKIHKALDAFLQLFVCFFLCFVFMRQKITNVCFFFTTEIGKEKTPIF